MLIIVIIALLAIGYIEVHISTSLRQYIGLDSILIAVGVALSILSGKRHRRR